MKQIDECLTRYFEGKEPLKKKWKALPHPKVPNILCLYHYHHLVLVYDTVHHHIEAEWWEKQADKRGLDSAKEWLNRRKQHEGRIRSS